MLLWGRRCWNKQSSQSPQAANHLAAWSLLWAESSLLVEAATKMSQDDLAKGTGGKEPIEALDKICPVLFFSFRTMWTTKWKCFCCSGASEFRWQRIVSHLNKRCTGWWERLILLSHNCRCWWIGKWHVVIRQAYTINGLSLGSLKLKNKKLERTTSAQHTRSSALGSDTFLLWLLQDEKEDSWTRSSDSGRWCLAD